MHRPTFAVVAGLSIVLLAACSASTPSASSLAASSTSATSTPSPTAAISASAAPTAAPTTLDPCKLVTSDEVSKLTGTTFGPGDASTTENNDKLCSYGQEGLVFEVLVAVAPDAATAKNDEPAFKAQLEQAISQAGPTDLKLTELPDFEPGVDAAVLSGSVTVAGQKITAIALYALKGAVLVALSDVAVGGSVPTSAAMQAQARLTLGRLP